MTKIKIRIQRVSELDSEYEADMVTFPGADGKIGILPGHTRLMTPLKAGVVRLKNDNEESTFEIKKGFLVVDKDEVRVLSG